MLRALLLAITITSVAACSSAYAEEDGSTGLSASAATSQIAPTYCRRYAACKPEDFASTVGTQERCVEAMTAEPSSSNDRVTQAFVDDCKRRIEQQPCASMSDKVECEK